MKYKITDDFLSKENFELMKATMIGDNFPWFYNNSIVPTDLGRQHFQFTHIFYQFWSWHNNWEVIAPLVNAINPKAWIRIKANLKTRLPEITEQGWHVDFDFPCTTAIFYLSDTDGYTVFEDGTKVECKANRLVEFDSKHKHSGTSHTDEKVRVLINMNYIAEGGK